VAHVIAGPGVSTSPEHESWLAHVLIGEPVSTSPEHESWLAHVLIGEPVSTSPEHALSWRGMCRTGAIVALLEVRGVARSFYGVTALRGVDLDVEQGRITGLIGPNGAGKTTLFNCISGLVPPDAGTILFAGRNITGRRPDEITRGGLTRTFQIARGFPRLTVLEHLLVYGQHQPGEALFAALARTAAVRRREDALLAKALTIAARLDLAPVLTNRASELSGGQKKLLEIGRALMADPKLILLDEPVAGVNPTLARRIGETLRALAAEGITILLIEHQMDTISRLCDHVIVMADGRHLIEGSFAELAGNPQVQDAYMGRGRWAS
jgi:ABC-type branched-subunit amino acid transport system ATPase component